MTFVIFAIFHLFWIFDVFRLYDVIHYNKRLILVFEYGDDDLKKYMNTLDDDMDLKTIKMFMYQIFKGIEYTHKMKVLHRDMKPQNLLVSEVIHPKNALNGQIGRNHQNYRFRPRQGLGHPSQELHQRGGHPVVQIA